MSEMKLAPTPWTTDDRFPGNVYCDDVIGSIISTCAGFRHAVNVYDPVTHARLIAAAPELLEALYEIRDHLYTRQDMDRCRDLAVAAIAKAEGR